MNPRFSVIVPACRCAPYLPRLLDSLDAQTFSAFETVFAVEDGGDESLAICRGYAGRRADVAVGDLPATGAGGAARNWAFRRARGKYLVMLDGDDWLESDALERIDRALRVSDEPDLALLRARVWTDDGEGGPAPTDVVVGNQLRLGSAEVLTGMETLARIAATGRHCQNYGALVAVRREFLLDRGLFQLEGVASEDSEWVPRLLLAARSVAGVEECVYNYRRRSGSVSSEKSARILEGVAQVVKSLGAHYRDAEMQPVVRRLLENDAVSIFCWYLFNPLYAKRFTDRQRLQALQAAMSGENGRENFRRMCRSVSRPKRWGLRLAVDFGLLRLAKLYFGCGYYPLATAVKGGR